MESETVKLLTEITDEGRFERLATAVMREADPRYVALSHPGVNAEGKTVKSPLDGIAFVPDANPPHLLAAHHTTTGIKGLENKWMHDPQTVKPRKNKPTGQPGDIIKTSGIVADERTREPATQATLALTTTMEPSQQLVRDAHAMARNHGIELDLWPRSRIAHFLDSPRGQWLRHLYLGIPQDHVSKELLAELSRKSLQLFAPRDEPDAWVDRAIDESLVQARGQTTFLVADAGLGKTVACYKLLARHVARDGFGLILPHQFVEQSLTASQAIDLALRQLHPQLAPDAGADALLLCEAALPFLIVVEDINRSGRPAELLDKISGWAGSKSGKSDSPPLWRVFCPVWPQALLGLKDQTRKQIEPSVLTCSLMSPVEGRAAVQQRGVMQGHNLSAMDADAIAAELGFDPLLIALHDVREKPDPHSAITRFINTRIGRTATATPAYTISDYRLALSALAQEMLSRRNLDPRWGDIVSWLAEADSVLPALRALVAQSEIIRLVTSGGEDRLAFRHDRVRDTLLTTALSERLASATLADDLLSDPFFAEMFGSILAAGNAPASFISDLAHANPLALFYGLARAASPGKASSIAGAITEWLATPDAQGASYHHLRWRALQVLSLVESPHVRGIVGQFKEQFWFGWAARFRNGDLAGGLELGMRLEPGTGDPWRDSLMEHVKLRFGANLVESVGHYLRQPGHPDAARLGALRIAGYLADARLADAVSTSWKLDENRLGHLDDYLVTAAYCCDSDPTKRLGPICDTWAALPAKAEKENYPSAREELAAHSVRFAFRHRPPRAAISYFIGRAKQEELNWPITYMLHEIDDPDALEFVARELAAIKRRMEASGGFSPFVMSAADRWSRSEDYDGKAMSRPTKERLLRLWSSDEGDPHLREQAFRLWAASLADGDLAILKCVGREDELWDRVLFARLVRGDHSAIPFLEEKFLTKKESYWWQAGRHIWSDRLDEALDQSLTRRGAKVERDWQQKHAQIDWIVSELIMALPVGTAEALLLKHWDHLRFASNFIHAALYTATSALVQRVQAAMAECPDPKEMMKHVDQHYGLKRKGRETPRLAQVESLIPYLALLDQHVIFRFRELCNEQGWTDFRTKHLDPLVTDSRYAFFVDDEHVFHTLDRFIAEDRIYSLDIWLDRLTKSRVNSDDLVQQLGRWLAARKSIEALRVVAAAIVHIGRRKDLNVLTLDGIEPRDTAAALIADTEFAVKLRTIH